jgi:hypothetical protein
MGACLQAIHGTLASKLLQGGAGDDGRYDSFPAETSGVSQRPFNNSFMSSVFASLDPVAIESAGYDFLRSEFTASRVPAAATYVQMPGVDDYLHQAEGNSFPVALFVFLAASARARLVAADLRCVSADGDPRQLDLGLGGGRSRRVIIFRNRHLDAPEAPGCSTGRDRGSGLRARRRRAPAGRPRSLRSLQPRAA